ncbi:MAG: acylphosphatase [Phycisphaerales bacterium]
MHVERFSILFRGRVQGVGFRATSRTLASAFAVTGWVRNEADGGVRMEVQGGRPEVERYLAALTDRMGRNIRSAERVPIPAVEGECAFEVHR